MVPTPILPVEVTTTSWRVGEPIENEGVPATSPVVSTESLAHGVEDAIPTVVEPVRRKSSVSVPDWSVENARSPMPPLKFFCKIEVIAEVVVAFPGPVMPLSLVRNERRAAVEVAESRLLRKSWSSVVPEEVFTTSSFVSAVEVPSPTLPFALIVSELIGAAWFTVNAVLLPTVRPPEKVEVAVVVVALKSPAVKRPTTVEEPFETKPWLKSVVMVDVGAR